MSETAPPSLEFIGRRLDSIQNDTADVRRRMIALGDRFGTIEARFGSLEVRMDGMERRLSNLEERVDRVVDRLTGIETSNARIEEMLKRMLPPT